MANAILFISWNQPHLGVFERMEIIGLTAHGGDMNGAIILSGERAKLDELRRTDEFEAFSMRMASLFDRYSVVPGLNWDGIQAVMARMQKAAK
jgi:hypothetical protein